MKIKYAAALLAVLLPLPAFTTGCSSGKKAAAASAAPLHVWGTVALVGLDVDFDTPSAGNECVGKGAFADLAKGARVRISDGTGQTLAVTRLGSGIANTSTTDVAAGFCDFTFDASVPSGKSSYTIWVTNHGDMVFAEGQMTAPQLSLG